MAEDAPGLDEDSLAFHALGADDAYAVERVLRDGPSGTTELVTIGGEGPYVRKRIPWELANAEAWARAMRASDPHLPRVEGMYATPDGLVVTYDYVEGTPLDELLAERGALGVARALDVFDDVCSAADALHAQQVVHRDVKPSNVIVSPRGAYLTDLGISRVRDEARERDTTVLGTRGFSAPEQFGFAQTDARSDVFSLGRLLACALTGEASGDRAYERLLACGGTARVVPSPGPGAGVASRVEGEAVALARLAGVARRACSFEPSRRYGSAGELARAAREAAGRTSEPTLVAGRPADPGQAAGGGGRGPRPVVAWISQALPTHALRGMPGLVGGVRSAGAARRLAVRVLAALLALFELMVVAGIPGSTAGLPPGQALGSAAILVSLGLWGLLLPAYELCSLLVGTGGYGSGASAGASLGLLVSRASAYLAAMLLVWVLASIVVALTGGAAATAVV
ncbi:serine/threonine-protein kinase [Atopobiaceae bacterium HCP3S3_F7]